MYSFAFTGSQTANDKILFSCIRFNASLAVLSPPIYVHIHIYIYMHICMYVYLYICVNYICMCVCIYAQMYMNSMCLYR